MTYDNTQSSTFSWVPLHRRRELLKALDQRLEPQEFHILGAGIAGLVAAIELLQFRNRDGSAKHQVVIYEGAPRIGGRILTHRVGPTPPPGEPDTRPFVELGAMRIPESHDYTWTYASEAGLQRRKFLNTDRTYNFNGQVYRLPQDLQRIVDAYQLTGEEREIVLRDNGGPGALFGAKIMGPEIQALDREYGADRWRRLAVDGRIEDPGLVRADRMTLGQVLDEHVARGNLTANGRAFIVDLQYLKDLEDRAFFMFARDAATNFGDHLWELCQNQDQQTVGGMDLLIQGLHSRLPEGVIRMRHEVKRITTDADGNWRVHFGSGEEIARDGQCNRHLLCTIPYSKLAYSPVDIELEGIQPEKLAAIRGVSYIDATKIGLYCHQRFWALPGQGGRSMSDQLSSASYYPNDRHEPEEIRWLAEPGGQGLTYDAQPPRKAFTLYTRPLDYESDEMPMEKTSGSTDWVLLSSYTYNETARRMEQLGNSAPRQTQQDLKAVYPDIERLTDPNDTTKSPPWAWRRYRWTRGAFVLPTSRNVSQFYQEARAPHRGLFFAGEGISPVPGWIQGAAYSSLYAVEHIQRTVLGLGAPDSLEEEASRSGRD